MTINWWTLGLQAVNVLILVWLLSRVLWRPVAGAIATRQEVSRAQMAAAAAAQSKADAALAEVAKARDGIAAERAALLAEAAAKADTAAQAVLAEAHKKAETLADAAQLASTRARDAARAQNAAKSAQLAVEIARKLLARLDREAVQAAFVELLVEAIDQMPSADRATLNDPNGRIELVSAADLGADDQARIADALGKALDGTPKLTFLTDPDLIAGFQMRTAHFALHNSWQADLDGILKGLKHAA